MTKTSTKTSAKTKTLTPRERVLTWEPCDVCGRRLADQKGHAAAHKSGLIGKDGKRTDAKAKAIAKVRVPKFLKAIGAKAKKPAKAKAKTSAK